MNRHKLLADLDRLSRPLLHKVLVMTGSAQNCNLANVAAPPQTAIDEQRLIPGFPRPSIPSGEPGEQNSEWICIRHLTQIVCKGLLWT